jgi:hypothetical protein
MCFQDSGQDQTILALVNAVLALGAQASCIAEFFDGSIPGMEYFARVKLLLATVLEENSIMSVQILNILVRLFRPCV